MTFTMTIVVFGAAGGDEEDTEDDQQQRYRFVPREDILSHSNGQSRRDNRLQVAVHADCRGADMAQCDRQEVVGEHCGEQRNNAHIDVCHRRGSAHENRRIFHGGNGERQTHDGTEQEHPLHHGHGRVFRGDGAGNQEISGVEQDIHETENCPSVAVMRIAAQREQNHHQRTGDAEENAHGFSGGYGFFEENGGHQHHHQRRHSRNQRDVSR